MSSYQFVISHRKGSLHVLPDIASRLPLSPENQLSSKDGPRYVMDSEDIYEAESKDLRADARDGH